jgi:hypothetical protein
MPLFVQAPPRQPPRPLMPPHARPDPLNPFLTTTPLMPPLTKRPRLAAPTSTPRPAGQAEAVHVFVDHSNLRFQSLGPINFHALRYMLLGNRQPSTLVAVGSHMTPVPSPNWEDMARADGWETKSYPVVHGEKLGK